MLHFKKNTNSAHTEVSAPQKLIFIFFILLSCSLFLFDQLRPRESQALRNLVLQTVSPLLHSVSYPVTKLHYWFVQWKNVVQSDHVIAKLQIENQTLREKILILKSFEEENEQLKTLLNYADQEQLEFTIGRVISQATSFFAKSFIVKAQSDALKDGQAAVSGSGLIGRVVHVDSQYARILHINDLTSRIPVMIKDNQYRGILAGNNSPRPEILYVGKNIKVTPGMEVVTSGDGGIFPSGLSVGKIVSVTDDQIFVEPSFEKTNMGYVMIIISRPKPDEPVENETIEN